MYTDRSKLLDDDDAGWQRYKRSTGQTAPTHWSDVFWVHWHQIFWSGKQQNSKDVHYIKWRPLSNWWCKCEQCNTKNFQHCAI